MARLAGGAQPGRARLAHVARHLRHLRRRRAGARRIGEDVQEGEAAILDQRAGEFRNIASSSVGKPAMRSAPNTTSGRSARTSAANFTASARRWRRFIRFRIMSSPACSERWRCGISRGSSAIRRSSSSSTSITSSEERRRRCSSGTSVSRRRTSCAQPRRARAGRRHRR